MERDDFPGTLTKGASFPGDPTMNYPFYLTPGTSTEIILNHPSASANTTDSCARDTMTSCDPPRNKKGEEDARKRSEAEPIQDQESEEEEINDEEKT